MFASVQWELGEYRRIEIDKENLDAFPETKKCLLFCWGYLRQYFFGKVRAVIVVAGPTITCTFTCSHFRYSAKITDGEIKFFCSKYLFKKLNYSDV